MEENHFKTQYDEHGEKLLVEIFSWFVNKTLPDVVLHVEDQPIEAHKLILGASSTFFKSIFCTRERKDFYFEDINYRTMKAIVEYMYTGELKVEWELMPECLKLADCLMIRGLSKLYCDKVVHEPAPVSEEMLEAIAAISQTRSTTLVQTDESNGPASESIEESWQKQSNLPKLQLKRDAKTGNWIPKNDDLTLDHNENTRVKPTIKRKNNELGSKETKSTKAYNETENFENTSKENMNVSLRNTISNNGSAAVNPIYNTALESDNLKFPNNCLADLKMMPNSTNFSTEQNFELIAPELISNNTKNNAISNIDRSFNATLQHLKNNSGILLNLNESCKKQIQEQNGKTSKYARKSAIPRKRMLDTANKAKVLGKTLRTAEQKSGTLRKNKQKQKVNATPTSTASKATDLLIKKLFFERNFPRNSKKCTPSNNFNNSNIASQPTEELENTKVIKTEPSETPTTGTKPLNRLAGRCKVSDWHIDESEVLECDEEYEQHKNAPCPQPAEFLKTEKLVYGCPSCNKAYTLKSNYRRHYVVTHRRQDMPVYKCPICDSRFTRTDNRNSHIRKIHDFADPLAVQAWNQPFYMCALCKKGFYNDNDLQNHLKTVHLPSRNSYCGRIA